MSLRKILLSSIATISLCGGVAMAQASSSQPNPGYPGTSPSTSYPYPGKSGDTTGGALKGATGETGAVNAASGTSLAAVSNPQTALKSASVESAEGTKIGKVSKVHVDAAGQAQSLDIKVGAKTVSLPAEQATFDQNNKTVVAMLTAEDIKNLPKPGQAPSTSATPSSGGSNMSPPATPSNQ